MRKKTIINCIVFLVGTVSLSVGMAGTHREGSWHGPQSGDRAGKALFPPVRMLQEVVGLTDEQLSELDRLREEFRVTVEPLFQQARGFRQAVDEELDQEQPSALRVGELVISGRDVRRQIGDARQSFRDTFEGILTTEQLEKLEEFKEREPSHRGFRRGRRGFRRF